MPHLIGSPGQTFQFRITDAQNVLACVGRLRTTGPAIGHTQDFTFAELQAGIGWLLEAAMSYTLRIIVLPPAGVVQITVETSAGGDTLSQDGAGQIGEWSIDVI